MVTYCAPLRSTRGAPPPPAISSTQKPSAPGARTMPYDATSTRVNRRYSTSTGWFTHGSRVLTDASTNRSSGPMPDPRVRSGPLRRGAADAGVTRSASGSVAWSSPSTRTRTGPISWLPSATAR